MGEQIVMCIYKEHVEREIMQDRAREEEKLMLKYGKYVLTYVMA